MFDRRALSKALSRVARAGVAEILANSGEARERRARVIGVTGPPGAGKSTLIGRLGQARLRHVNTLAVIAIDPTSPRNDGSLLGDRIRMQALTEDPRVFMRSLPSLKTEDGLTDNIAEIIATLDDFGFDEILVETVGAGQTAYGVRVLADVELLVLTPGAGDYVQAMKAGIMETADCYVVNKADLPGADRVVADLLGIMRNGADGEPPAVICVRADERTGIDTLDSTVQSLLARDSTSAQRLQHRRTVRRFQVQKLIQRRLQEIVAEQPEAAWEEPLADLYTLLVEKLARL